jgi:hypothetical protein
LYSLLFAACCLPLAVPACLRQDLPGLSGTKGVQGTLQDAKEAGCKRKNTKKP